ncbi:HAD-IIIA family hydrolase [Opitutus sp. ER46]|uniref:D-glycero-alpha-D-manno-heptose-1,7-bisphosphate 7-phosphatase n=1 Tax=Opitutus sp. ER46 TaxID=2161864 RepID=UPI001304CBFF|nr:HAD-IIIA family hydrolase [Opitutus sp. ER46]
MHPSSASPGRAALFLDRDGTLILDKHYLADPAGVELIPGVPAALQCAKAQGYDLFLFTNQSGIGRGMYTLDDTLRCNARMEELIGLPAPLFTDVCIAPEAPDQPQQYRKPSPRFILESIARHGLDPDRCWMVGDNLADVQAGQNAGINLAVVCTGKLTADQWAARGIPNLHVFPTLVEFARSLAAS